MDRGRGRKVRGRKEKRGRERERAGGMTEKLFKFNNTLVAGDYGKNSFREGLEARKRGVYIYIFRGKNLRMTWKSYSVFPPSGAW